MVLEEITIRVKLPSLLVEETRKRGISEQAIARAALKLSLLDEVISRHGLEEEDIQLILSRKRKARQ